jgi:putative ABC transport system permease protein
MGAGMIVTGLACVVVGEGLLGRRTLRRQIAGTLIGTIAFRLLVAAAVAAGLPGDALKLATAVFVLVALGAPAVLAKVRWRLERQEAAR